MKVFFKHLNQVYEALKGKFLFLAVEMIILLQILYYFHWAWLIGLAFWLLRLWKLNGHVLRAGILLGLLIIGGSQTVWKKEELPLQSGTYMIKLDTYYLNQGNQGVQGKAKVLTDSGWQFVQVQAKDIQKEEFPRGISYMKVEGEMLMPEPARNFGVFHYANYLKTKGINRVLKVKKLVAIQQEDGIRAWFSEFRDQLAHHFLKFDSFPIMSLYNRLVWNLNSQAYQLVKDDLANLGIIHFFALSGLHVTLLSRYFTLLLKRLGILNEMVHPLVLILIGVYTYLTGFPIGVLRSFLMMLLKYVTSFNRLDRLSLAAMFYLCFFPYSVGSLGFTLSFLISLVLIWANDLELGQMKPLVMSLMCLSFTWSFTLSSSYFWFPFQVFWVLGLGILFDKIFLVFSLSMTLISFFPSLVVNVGAWIGKGIGGVRPILEILNPSFLVGAIPWWLSLCLFLSAGMLLVNLKKGLMLNLIVYLIILGLGGRLHGSRIIILDVGQGDAFLYQPAWSKQTLLVDTGGKPLWQSEKGQAYDSTFGMKNIVPALYALGISQLEQVIITHPDLDHMGNLPILLEKVKVKQILVNRESIENPHFIKMIHPYSIPVKEVGLGKNQFGRNIEVYNLGVLDDANLNDRSNESSLLVRLKLGPYFFLNMGDMSKAGERQLVEEYPEIRAEFLKVGHHGSSTSTDSYFLQKIEAKVGIISAGVENRYGHPHEEVLNNLRERNMILRQTNRDGAIMIDFTPVLDRITMDTAIK